MGDDLCTNMAGDAGLSKDRLVGVGDAFSGVVGVNGSGGALTGISMHLLTADLMCNSR